MGWIVRKIRSYRVLHGLRPGKEKHAAACRRCRFASGWEELYAQMALEGWIRINGLK